MLVFAVSVTVVLAGALTTMVCPEPSNAINSPTAKLDVPAVLTVVV